MGKSQSTTTHSTTPLRTPRVFEWYRLWVGLGLGFVVVLYSFYGGNNDSVLAVDMFSGQFLKSAILEICGGSKNMQRIGHCLQCVAVQNTFHHKSLRFSSQTIYEQHAKPYDPHLFIKNELRNVNNDIIKELNTSLEPLKTITQYYFDSKGKMFRPAVILLMATVCNKHLYQNFESLPSKSQKTIARVAEMIHTASLVHDDIIDLADSRRGKPSTHNIWGEKEAVLAGNYIMSRATKALARLGDTEVIELLSRVLDDLVRGEFMQIGSREDPNERFTHYFDKTFKKTASLLAYTCRSVALLANGSKELQDIAFQYGRNLGMTFQLVDDVLDFNSTQEVLGKPAAADLRLGLATGPVLFASEEFPEITAFILRRFKGEHDVEETYELVRQSTGIERTMNLAKQHSREAIRQLTKLRQSPERDALVELTENLLKRER